MIPVQRRWQRELLGSRRWKGAKGDWVCKGETDQRELMGAQGTAWRSGYQRVREGEVEQRERGFAKVKQSRGRWWEHEGQRNARVRRGLENVKKEQRGREWTGRRHQNGEANGSIWKWNKIDAKMQLGPNTSWFFLKWKWIAKEAKKPIQTDP